MVSYQVLLDAGIDVDPRLKLLGKTGLHVVVHALMTKLVLTA